MHRELPLDLLADILHRHLDCACWFAARGGGCGGQYRFEQPGFEMPVVYLFDTAGPELFDE